MDATGQQLTNRKLSERLGMPSDGCRFALYRLFRLQPGVAKLIGGTLLLLSQCEYWSVMFCVNYCPTNLIIQFANNLFYLIFGLTQLLLQISE